MRDSHRLPLDGSSSHTGLSDQVTTGTADTGILPLYLLEIFAGRDRDRSRSLLAVSPAPSHVDIDRASLRSLHQCLHGVTAVKLSGNAVSNEILMPCTAVYGNLVVLDALLCSHDNVARLLSTIYSNILVVSTKVGHHTVDPLRHITHHIEWETFVG